MRIFESARPTLDKADQYLYRIDADYEGLAAQADLAQREIERGILLAPDLAQGPFLLGRAWEIKGWDDKAAAEWRKAIVLDGRFRAARFRLGRLLIGQARISRTSPVREAVAREAGEQIEAAMGPDTGPDGEISRESAAAMLALVRGDLERVRRTAQAGLERFGKAEGIEELYWLLGIASEGDARRKAFDEAIRRRPHYPLALVSRGSDKNDAGDLAGSIVDFDAAIRIHPRLAIAYADRAGVKGRQGDYDGVIADCDKAIEINPDLAMAYFNRASAHAHRQDLDAALRDADTAVRLAPRWPLAILLRGSTQRDRGALEEAKADLEQVLETARPGWSKRAAAEEMLEDVKRKLASLPH